MSDLMENLSDLDDHKTGRVSRSSFGDSTTIKLHVWSIHQSPATNVEDLILLSHFPAIFKRIHEARKRDGKAINQKKETSIFPSA